MEPPISLSRLVFRHYLRSALVPVLSIELLLVTTYFLVTAWNTRRTLEAMRVELSTSLPFLAGNRAELIDANLARVASATGYMAHEHERLEADPDDFRVTGAAPVLARAPNGTTYQSNRRDGSGLFFPVNAPMTPRQRRIGLLTATLDPVYRHVASLPNVVASYYNTCDNTNRLYPYLDKVWEQYPAVLDMARFNFYYMADSLHDPQRRPVWTGTYLDPAGNGWMVSCVAPVYLGDTLRGVVGADLTVANLISGLLTRHFPWDASAFLADDSGMILAMPPELERFLGLSELKGRVYDRSVRAEQLRPQDYSLFRNPDSRLSAQFRRAYAVSDTVQTLRIRDEDVFLIQSRIPQTGWRVFLLARADEVFRSEHEIARFSHRIGLFVIGLMAVFYLGFFLFLRAKAKGMAASIAHPISELARATSRLGKEVEVEVLPLQGIQEIDALTGNFNQLAAELERRSRELVDSRVQARVQAKEGELAYARGLYESASGYLHNVGNLTTRLASDILDLETLLKSTEQYPEVFRRIREEGDRQLLDSFETVLTTRMVPRLRSAADDIADVRDCIHRTIAHQQSAFLDGRNDMMPVRFSLSELMERIGQEFAARAASRRIALDWRIEPGIEVSSHRDQLYHGIVNLVKNSLEAIDGTGTVAARLERTGSGTRITLSDTGSGLSEQELGQILHAGFTTKSEGHGLGLHSFSLFLSGNGGDLRIASPGKGKGCTVTIELPHA
jgi:signal transduction histidine kinase